MYQLLVQNLVLKYGIKHVYKHLKYKRPTVFQAIIDYNVADISFAEKVYRYVHEISRNPPCNECGNPVSKFKGYHKGYAIFCSRKCVANSKITKSRIKRTLKQKYGAESLVETRWNK